MPEGRSPEPARLLVVDDQEFNRDVLVRRLAQRGYAVSDAPGGREALAALASGPFDLVLLDVMMPEVSGLDVLREIRRTRSLAELPVIMATARDASEDVVEALRLGANDYVTKPLDFAVVAARIETQLRLKRAAEEIRRLNEKLRSSQDRIASLLDSAPEAAADFGRWCRTTAAALAPALDAREAAVFLLEEERLVPVGETACPVPPLAFVGAAEGPAPVPFGDAESAIPARGASGDLLGALVVCGKTSPWSDVEARLAATFVRQIAGALELERMRAEVASARRRRADEDEAAARSAVRVCAACQRCHEADATRCEVCGARLPAPRGTPYRLLDRYRLVRVLGEGGMGTVFHAYDQRLDRDVAVKILKPEHFHDPGIRERFRQEARAIARIEHAGVVALFDAGDLGDGSGFLVMEKLDGCDLKVLLSAFGRGTPAQVADVFTQAGAALAAAHRAGIVHRDVKPENIFLSDRPEGGYRVKILDFGLAKEKTWNARLTQSGLIVGTPAYMAPEQIRGRDVDARTDLYSFAAVLYESLVGRPVTNETEVDRIFYDVVQNDPPAPSTLLPGTPRAVDEAFERALAKVPADRPADVERWVESFASRIAEIPPNGAIGWPTPLPAGSTWAAPAGEEPVETIIR